MAGKEVVVLARFKARQGKEEQVKQELKDLLAPTRKEPGCKYYECHEVSGIPGEFVFYEVWESQAALDEHLQRPHLQALLAKVEELFAEAPDIRFLVKLS